MGDMADDAIEGFACSECGVYFEDAHGYPVLCRDCYREAKRHGKPELPRATNPELGHD